MKRTLLFCLFFAVLAVTLGATEVTGYWKTIDDETGEVKSIVGIYENGGKLFGRILVVFEEGVYLEDYRNPKKIAEESKGQPLVAGLDILYNMEESGSKYKKGKIMDPKNGKHYSCELWLDGDNLIVRGKIGPFGRNQTWVQIDGSEGLPADLVLPDMSGFNPVIPQ